MRVGCPVAEGLAFQIPLLVCLRVFGQDTWGKQLFAWQQLPLVFEWIGEWESNVKRFELRVKCYVQSVFVVQLIFWSRNSNSKYLLSLPFLCQWVTVAWAWKLDHGHSYHLLLFTGVHPKFRITPRKAAGLPTQGLLRNVAAQRGS